MTRFLIFWALVTALGCNRAADRAPESQPASPAGVAVAEPPSERLGDDVRPLSYRLTLEIVPSRPTFSGVAQIEIELERSTTSIYLHAKNLHWSSARVVFFKDGASGAATAETKESVAAEFLPLGETGLGKLQTRAPVGPGRVELEIAYEANFDPHLLGLYRVDSADHAYAFTQFEPVAARHAFPCFDEPRFKTPFEITLRVPKSDVAIANTREIASRSLDSAVKAGVVNGAAKKQGTNAIELKEVKFARTEKLPTYLVAFAVGPFDVVEAPPLPKASMRDRELPLRGIAPKGRGKDLAFALSETPKLLESLERYFDIGYPYDKLDLIAVPDFRSGAMENAGAITFRDSLLLLADDAPEGQRRACIGVNAHELAHQWFGNLVTMPWWDDVWLNEAFATWMAGHVVDEVHPEFEAGPSRLGYTHYAMDVDSKASARQIRQPIESEHDISNAFDAITYSKGGAVLSMFERYLGVERFRAGLRLYMTRHRFGSATARDLLRALDEASGEPVGESFTTFLEQPGVPVLATELSCEEPEKPRVHLKQQRYLPLGSTANRNRQWQVPVCLRFAVADAAAAPIAGAKIDVDVKEQCLLAKDAVTDFALEATGCPRFIFPNAGGQGYYRWSLYERDFQALLENGFDLLTVEEKLSLLQSADAALRAGWLSFDKLLATIEKVVHGEKRELLQASLDVLSRVRNQLLSLAELKGYRAYVRKLTWPRLREVGLFPHASQSQTGEILLLRSTVISGLAFEAWDETVRAELAKLGRARLLLGQDSRIDRLPSELVELSLAVAVQEGGLPVIKQAIARLLASSDGLERGRLLGALGSNRDPVLTPEVLQLALNPRVRSNEVLQPILAQAAYRETREIAFTWTMSHYAELVERLGEESAVPLISSASGFCTEQDAARAEQFFGSRVDKLTGGPRTLSLTLETVRLCAAFAEAQGSTARKHFAESTAAFEESGASP